MIDRDRRGPGEPTREDPEIFTGSGVAKNRAGVLFGDEHLSGRDVRRDSGTANHECDRDEETTYDKRSAISHERVFWDMEGCNFNDAASRSKSARTLRSSEIEEVSPSEDFCDGAPRNRPRGHGYYLESRGSVVMSPQISGYAPVVDVNDRTRKNNRNVYILGAGYSVDAGLPTVATFLNQMRDAQTGLSLNTWNESGRQSRAF